MLNILETKPFRGSCTRQKWRHATWVRTTYDVKLVSSQSSKSSLSET